MTVAQMTVFNSSTTTKIRQKCIKNLSFGNAWSSKLNYDWRLLLLNIYRSSIEHFYSPENLLQIDKHHDFYCEDVRDLRQKKQHVLIAAEIAWHRPNVPQSCHHVWDDWDDEGKVVFVSNFLFNGARWQLMTKRVLQICHEKKEVEKMKKK